jgi:predicted nucleotidyltransferase
MLVEYETRREVEMIASSRISFSEEQLADICRRYHVRELSLFGSVLRDDFQDASDVDVLVEFEPDARVGFFALARLQRELASLFGRHVDVVPKKGLNSAIRQSVLTTSEVIYAV